MNPEKARKPQSGMKWLRLTARLAPRVLRVVGVLSVILTVLALIVATVGMRRARAQLGEGLLNMGAEMLRYEFANPQAPPQEYRINGQSFWLRTGNTEQPVETVLDWFEARCMAHDGQLGEQLEESLQQAGETVDVDTRLLDPVIREGEVGRRGVVACLDSGTERLELTTLASRLQSFTETLRLSDIGDFRFAYVVKGRRKTVFVTMWTEGVIDLGEMFATDGDVPGQDVAGVPRPREFRRILSAVPANRVQSITMYEGTGTKVQVQQFYKQQMPFRGWRRVELTAEEAAKLPFKQEPTGDALLYYKLGDRDVAVMVQDPTPENKTIVVVLTL